MTTAQQSTTEKGALQGGSRIGKRPVSLPDKVKIEFKPGFLRVTGPKGVVEKQIPADVEVTVEGNQAMVQVPRLTRSNKGFRGLVRALLANMVHGVTNGFERSLEITGVGYKAEQKGNSLTLSLGFSHTITLPLPTGVHAEVGKGNTSLKISGIDKQEVHSFAAQIRGLKPCEPYKGKGVKYVGEIIRRKVGKAGAK